MDTALATCLKNQYAAMCVRALERHGRQTMTGQRFLQPLGAQPPDDML